MVNIALKIPIVVKTVDAKNIACILLHFSDPTGKLFSGSISKPP